MIIMKPTEGELHLASHVGVLRVLYAVSTDRERRPGMGSDNAGFGEHINGAIGEMMLAKHRGVYWAGTIGTIHAPADVGRCYQVRATTLPQGKLIVRPTDQGKLHQPFVLARVLLPEVHLVGWLWGHEAKQDMFFYDDHKGPPMWLAFPFRDMATLPKDEEEPPF